MSSNSPPSTTKAGSTRRAQQPPRDGPSMVQRARRSAGKAAGKVAYNAAHAGATQAASLYRRVVAPVFAWFFQLMRSITSAQASVTACLAVVALVVALSGLGTLGALSTIRKYAYVKADIVRPLEFDYSGPVAMAEVSLKDIPPGPAFFSWLGSMLTFSLHTQELLYPNVNPAPPATTPAPVYANPYAAGSTQQPRHGHSAYSQHVVSSMGPADPLAKALAGAAHSELPERALSPGQIVSVAVSLDLPADHTDLFMVAVELQGEGGRQLAKQARAYMPPRTSLITQAIKLPFVLPWQLLGWSHTHHVKLQLIDRYVEQQAPPLVSARVLLSSRNASVGALPPPAVYTGQLRVKLRLSLARWLLHWVCPSWPLTVALGAGAVLTTLLSGVAAVLLLIVTLLLHRLSGAGQGRGAALSHLDPVVMRRLRSLLMAPEAAPVGRGARPVKVGPGPNIKLLDYTGEEVSTDAGSEYSPHAAGAHGRRARMADMVLSEGGEEELDSTYSEHDHYQHRGVAHEEGEELHEGGLHDRQEAQAWGSEQGDTDRAEAPRAPGAAEGTLPAGAVEEPATITESIGKEREGEEDAAQAARNAAKAAGARYPDVPPAGLAGPEEAAEVSKQPAKVPAVGSAVASPAGGAPSSKAAKPAAAGKPMPAAREAAAGKQVGAAKGPAATAATAGAGRPAEEEVVSGGLFAALQQQVRQRPAAAAGASGTQEAR